MSVSRRELLKIGAAATATGAIPLAAVMPNRTSVAYSRGGRRPRNVVFMVSDGMSAGVPGMADAFSQHERDRGTHWAALARNRETVHGMFDMASLDSLVTDSAAAASAWATGSRVNNSVINILPDGTELAPIGVLAKETGRRVGLVTTTRITHATPAGFAAVVPSRGFEDDIAEQYIGLVDVMLGGGSTHFSADMLKRCQQLGYRTLTHRHELFAMQGITDKVLGLFAASHFPYVLDRRHTPSLRDGLPTLAEMTRAALLCLAREPQGFFLMVEGGRVDHAAHANDAAALMWEQLDFDDAIGVVREVTSDRDDTLVLIATDHGTANPGLNGLGGGYRESAPALYRLGQFTESFSSMQRSALAESRPRGLKRMIQNATGIDITDEEAEVLFESARRRPVPERNQLLTSFRGQLGQILGNHTGVTFTGIRHTADWAMSMATGLGREHFAGLMRNTSAYSRLADLMNISHQNPVA